MLDAANLVNGRYHSSCSEGSSFHASSREMYWQERKRSDGRDRSTGKDDLNALVFAEIMLSLWKPSNKNQYRKHERHQRAMVEEALEDIENHRKDWKNRHMKSSSYPENSTETLSLSNSGRDSLLSNLANLAWKQKARGAKAAKTKSFVLQTTKKHTIHAIDYQAYRLPNTSLKLDDTNLSYIAKLVKNDRQHI